MIHCLKSGKNKKYPNEKNCIELRNFRDKINTEKNSKTRQRNEIKIKTFKKRKNTNKISQSNNIILRFNVLRCSGAHSVNVRATGADESEFILIGHVKQLAAALRRGEVHFRGSNLIACTKK